jgi:prephenate dehydrogenase
MKITVIGLGLIGGSIAKDLKSQLNVEVWGVDASEDHMNQALDLGLVHAVAGLDDGIKDAEMVIISIPVNKIEGLLPMVLDKIDPKTTVIDVGSTKDEICRTVSRHPNRKRFVAAHPLAGTEFSGPTAAIKGLFQNKKNIICEKDKSAPDALDAALKLFESSRYDYHHLCLPRSMTNTWHMCHTLSHVSSFMLGIDGFGDRKG